MSVVTKENNPELYNALFPEDKIKETINILYDFATNVNSDYIYDAHSFDYPLISDCIEELLDYITNLQEENERLKKEKQDFVVEQNALAYYLVKQGLSFEDIVKIINDFKNE